eukprot:802586_1
MSTSIRSGGRKRARLSYLEFKAEVKKRDGKQWKAVTMKIFDNAKLQWFKMKNGDLVYKNEIDLLKMTRFGKSAKHHNCIEVFVKGIIGSTKHKFQFDNLNHYVTFMKYLDKFTLVNFRNSDEATRDSIESLSQIVMQQENTTVDDLQKARLHMVECPKGTLPRDFVFPDFHQIIKLVRDLWYVLKTAPSMTAGKIKSAMTIASQLREDCLIYVSHYITVFEDPHHQQYFESCLDLVWECIKFDSYFECVTKGINSDALPVSILRSCSSFSLQSEGCKDEDEYKEKRSSETQQKFVTHVMAAMKTGIHNSITNRLSYLRDESVEDKKSFLFSLSRYDSELFDAADQSDIAIDDNVDLCCIYAIHDVYKFIERLKKSHDIVFKKTFNEFFNVGNIHTLLSDGLINPTIQFIDDYQEETQKCIEHSKRMTYKQIKIIYDEINVMYGYFMDNCTENSNPLLSVMNMIHSASAEDVSAYHGVNQSIIDFEKKHNHMTNKTQQHQCWLKLKKMSVLSSFNDYFISNLSEYLGLVERAIASDDFKPYGHLAEDFKKLLTNENTSVPHSTSSTDVICLIEKKVKVLLKNDLKPMQIVQLAEMITSIVMTYITITLELAHKEINESNLGFEPVGKRLSDSKSGKSKDFKRFLNMNYYKRKASVTVGRHHRISSVLGIKSERNAIIKERLLVMVGNVANIRTLFNAVQCDFDLENKYFESINICNGAMEINAALTSSSESHENYKTVLYHTDLHLMRKCVLTKDNAMAISIMKGVRPLLKSKKFYDAVEATFEEIAQHLSEKVSHLLINLMAASIFSITNTSELFQDNPDENRIKCDVLDHLYSILLSFDGLPQELSEFQHYLTASFLSHLFTAIEKRFLLPNTLQSVLGMNEILFLNNLLRDFEGLLSEFNIISDEELSTNHGHQYPELKRIHAIIVIYLSNTTQLIEDFENELMKSNGTLDEQDKEQNAPDIDEKTLLLLIKYRADVRNDKEAKQFLKQCKITATGTNDNPNDKWTKKLQHIGGIFKKKTDTLKRTLSRNSSISTFTTPATSFSLD